MSADAQDLQLRLDLLRRELPGGAPVLVVPSVRARDRVEVSRGLTFDLGLASSLLCDELMGEVAWIGGPAFIARGTLDLPRFNALAPLLEPHARAKDPVAIVADDVDESALMMTLINRRQAGFRTYVLTPTGGPARGIDALSRAIGAKPIPHSSASQSPRKLTLVATLEGCAMLDGALPDAAPLGLMWVGGADLREARERARVARELSRG